MFNRKNMSLNHRLPNPMKVYAALLLAIIDGCVISGSPEISV